MLAWVGLAVAVAALVIVRQYQGWRLQGRLDKLREEVAILTGQQADLEGELATLRSLAVLGPKARALGLRVASDRELRELPVPQVR